MKLFKVEIIKHNMFAGARFDCYVVAENMDAAGKKALEKMNLLNIDAENVARVELIADEENHKDGWLLIT